MDPAMTEIYEKLHDRGVMVIVSVTGSADRVKDRRDRRVEYLRTLLSEPDIIETDYPAYFVGLPVGREEAARDPRPRGGADGAVGLSSGGSADCMPCGDQKSGECSARKSKNACR